MLNIFARASVSRVTDPIGKALVRVGLTPNAMTVFGTAGAVICALVFFPNGYLLAGTFTVWGFAMLDLLDGAMARARGYGTPFGAVLDATCDRLVDGAVFAAIAWWCFVRDNNHLAGAAALICRGLARNRPIIAFPFLLALLSRIGGILPDRVRRWTDVPFRFTVQPHGRGALRSGGAPPDHP